MGEPPRAPSPDPRWGQAGGAASPPASPGAVWEDLCFTPEQNLRTPPPPDRAGAGEGAQAQEQVTARFSLRAPRLAGLPTRLRARACVSDGGGWRGRPVLPRGPRSWGEATAQAAQRPLPTPHLAIVLALVKWKAKETRMERQGTRRSGQGRDDAQPGRAGGQTRIAYVRSLPLTGHLLFAAGRQSRPPPRGRRAWGRRAGSQGVARGGTRP